MAKQTQQSDPSEQVPVQALSAPLTQADFLAVVDRLIGSGNTGISAEQLDAILKSQASAVQKAMKPENPTAPNVSVYNPSGGEKAGLTYARADGTRRPRKTYFVGARMDDDLLTPLEIELFNRITSSRSARNGRWTAIVKQNGDDQELHVMVPHKELDDRQNLPNGLTLILRELLDGPAAADPESLIARLEAAEQKLAALGAA